MSYYVMCTEACLTPQTESKQRKRILLSTAFQATAAAAAAVEANLLITSTLDHNSCAVLPPAISNRITAAQQSSFCVQSQTYAKSTSRRINTTMLTGWKLDILRVPYPTGVLVIGYIISAKSIQKSWRKKIALKCHTFSVADLDLAN